MGAALFCIGGWAVGRESVDDDIESFGEEDFWVDVIAERERLLDSVHEEFEDEGCDGGVEVSYFAGGDTCFHLFCEDVQVDFVRAHDAFSDFWVSDTFFCEYDEESSVVFVGSEVREQFKGELLQFTERGGFGGLHVHDGGHGAFDFGVLQGFEDISFGGEVEIDSSFGEACFLGDIVDSCMGISVLDKALHGGAEDLLPSFVMRFVLCHASHLLKVRLYGQVCLYNCTFAEPVREVLVSLCGGRIVSTKHVYLGVFSGFAPC